MLLEITLRTFEEVLVVLDIVNARNEPRNVVVGITAQRLCVEEHAPVRYKLEDREA